MTSNRYSVTIPLTVHGPDRATHFQLVADCYARLEEQDPALLDAAWSLSDGDSCGEIDVEITVVAETDAAAFDKASGSVRSAIHEAGGFTPGWDERTPELDAVVYRLRDGEDVEALA